MSAPLSKAQKRHLAQLARRAWDRAQAESDGQLAQTMEAYRHAQVAAACGKLGLRCCSQADYKIVEAHFLNLLGETGQALAALVRHQSNPARVARWKLDQACAAAGVDVNYAASICRSMFKCRLDEATESQLWKLTFTIKNRGRKVTFAQQPEAA